MHREDHENEFIELESDESGPEKLPKGLDSLLSDFSDNGVKVSLYRKTPLNCSGYLASFPLDSSISIDSIKEAYGGKDFQLRILDARGHVLGLRAFKIADVPRIDGVPLSDHIDYKKGGQVIENDPNNAVIQRMQEQINKQAKHNEALLLRMIEMNNAHNLELRKATAIESSKSDPMQEVKRALELVSEVKNISGADSGDSEGGINAMEILSMLKDEMTQRREPVSHRKIPLPRPKPLRKTQPNPERSQHAQNIMPVKIADNQQSENEDIEQIEAEKLADLLSSFDPEEAAEIVADAMERYNPDEQKRAIDTLLGKSETMENNENNEGLDKSESS